MDSVYTGYDSLYWFRYDSSYTITDTIPPGILVLREVKVYHQPAAYHSCMYVYSEGVIFEAVIVEEADSLLGTALHDLIITREEINRRFLLSPDHSNTDRIILSTDSPDNTFLTELLSAERQQYLARINGDYYSLIHYDTTWRTIGGETRIIGDTLTAQLSGDTLYYLEKDSSISFGGNIFAENTSLHMNGKVDIYFSNEPVTEYTADTVDVITDSITGDIIEYKVQTSGVWVPERASCWSTGLRSDICHDPGTGEALWYAEDAF
jgi:hypothetical protein